LRRGLAPSALVLPLPATGAFPAVAGREAGAGAVSLAAALLAGAAQRRWLVGAAVLVLSCGGVAARGLGYQAYSAGTKNCATPRPGPLPRRSDPAHADPGRWRRGPQSGRQVDGGEQRRPRPALRRAEERGGADPGRRGAGNSGFLAVQSGWQMARRCRWDPIR